MADGLKKLFEALQQRLLAGLSASRTVIEHPVAKGDASEANWLDMLQRHLPHRYQADKAFVIDSKGAMSEQIDIVIYDRQYTPIMYNHDDQRVIPAESVYAVFEVKQELSKSTIEYAGNKAASVRNMERTSAEIIHAGGKHDPRVPIPILAGILTYKSSWSPPFGDSFADSLAHLDIAAQLNIGCSVCDAGFDVSLDSNGKLQIEISTAERAIVFFLMRLLQKLQMVGTVTAIDYDAYMKWLK
jgi:hypothetical protein